MDIFLIFMRYMAVCLSFFFIFFVAHQKKSALCSNLLLFSGSVLLNGLSYLFELKSDIVEEAMMAVRFEYIGLSLATIAALLFICELFHVRLKRWLRIALILCYSVSCVVVATNEYHHLHYKKIWLERWGQITVFRLEPGINYAFHTAITLGAMGICVGVIVYAYIRDVNRKKNYKKYLFLGLAALAPLFFWFLRFVVNLKNYDLIPFGLFCTNTCFILILYFFQIFDVAESAKNEVLETMEEGILVSDEEGHIVYQNRRMQEIIPKEHPKNISEIFCEMESADDGEFRIGNRYYTVTESEVYEGDQISGKTWCFIDITLTKEREQKLKELNQMATAANNAKSSFLANMSHEIRTPINTILGMNELISREARNPKALEYSDNIKNEGKALLSLINDLLDFTKIESGKMELTEAEYQTSSLLHDVVTMFSLKAEEKGLEMQVDIAEDIPSVLCGDELRLKQIINNLLSNAVKYTERGYIRFAVDWSLQDEKTALLRIAVKDSGIGIRKEELNLIFEKFRRLDLKRNSGIEGAGLGMNITAQLLSMMKGDISIESEYGTGSEFKVRIPQKIINASPIGRYAYIGQKAEREWQGGAFTAPQARVLVVDDNIMNRVVLKGLLERTLLQVEEACGGEECLRMAEHTRYDCILMDHMMPGMNGIEALHLLRKGEGASRDVPVIVLTANAMVGVKEYYISEGFDDYLSKPISGAKLEGMLLRYLPEKLVQRTEVGCTDDPDTMQEP